jgi:sugar phosphate permease
MIAFDNVTVDGNDFIPVQRWEPLFRGAIVTESRERRGSSPLRYRWAILGVAWISYMAVYMVRTSVPPLSPFIVEELSLSKTEVGLLISAGALGYSVFQLPAGWLIDRVGVKKMLAAGTFAAGVIIINMLLASSLPVAFTVLFLGGFGYGCFPAVATKALLQWFPPNERGTAVGIQQTSINAAGIITAMTLPLVASGLSWRYGFVAVGLLSIAASVISLRFYKEPPGFNLGTGSEVTHIRIGWTTIREVILNRNIQLVSISCIGYMAVDYSLVTYLIIYLKEAVGVAVTLAGFYLALTNIGGLLGKLFFGLMSDRVFKGSRKKPLLLAGCIMFVVSIIVQAISPGTPSWAIAIIFAVFGFSAIGWGGQNLILVSESVKKDFAGLAMGYSLMILLIGNIIGPPIFGYIVDITGSYSPAWWFLTACSVAAIAIMSLVREEKVKNV